jgi:hypothetical protein
MVDDYKWGDWHSLTSSRHPFLQLWISLSFFCLLFLLSFPTHLGFSLKAHSGQLLGGSCVGDKSCNFVPVSWNRWACPLGLIAETGRGFCHICQEWALQSNVKLSLFSQYFCRKLNCCQTAGETTMLTHFVLCTDLSSLNGEDTLDIFWLAMSLEC